MLTVNEIKIYKINHNLASYYHRKSDASLYAKIKSWKISLLSEKIKAQTQYETEFNALTKETQTKIAMKMIRNLN